MPRPPSACRRGRGSSHAVVVLDAQVCGDAWTAGGSVQDGRGCGQPLRRGRINGRRFRQFRRRGRAGSGPVGLHEVLHVLRVALERGWLRLRAAAMRRHLRAGQTIAPEHGSHRQGDHYRDGGPFHLDSDYHRVRDIATLRPRKSAVSAAGGASGIAGFRLLLLPNPAALVRGRVGKTGGSPRHKCHTTRVSSGGSPYRHTWGRPTGERRSGNPEVRAQPDAGGVDGTEAGGKAVLFAHAR